MQTEFGAVLQHQLVHNLKTQKRKLFITVYNQLSSLFQFIQNNKRQ